MLGLRIRLLFQHRLTRVTMLLLAVAFLALLPTELASTIEISTQIDGRLPIFEASAAGLSGKIAEEWVLSPFEGIGLISGIARCDDEVFLVDVHESVVHRFILSTGRSVGHVGPLDTGGSTLRYPTAIAADCAGGHLYVVDITGVLVFDLATGELKRRFPKPPGFVVSTGVSPVFDSRTSSLYVSGLWTPMPQPKWLSRNLYGMFERDHLGYRLDLLTGDTSQLFPSIERNCWTFSSHCLSVALDRVNDQTDLAWLAAQGLSLRIGLFHASYKMIGTIDVRSPMFLRDGRRLLNRAPLARQMALQETNSVIRQVYSLGDVIAVVHSSNRTRNWRKGLPMDFEVFMNLYSADGSGLVSDIRLPNLPVGHDASNVYVLDYGPNGRRHAGSLPLTLMRLDIADLRSPNSWQGSGR